jgi:pullulanase/glycogen debranching enzyme
MVKALHRAGIEVILDVVYNHTAEGNHLGPNAVVPGHRQLGLLPSSSTGTGRYYYDTTGTGNSLNVRHHESLRLIMDSLRYWVIEMHVDGFRFDLAASLAREFHEVDRLAAFFDLVNQDPIVSQVKLIAEPWDVGDGGYQVGGFPPLWTEWNGKYRDTVARLLAGRAGHAGRVRVPVHRLLGPLRDRRPAADRVDQLRDGARRLHAARPGLLQREAQRGQRRVQRRRREPQPVLERRHRGPSDNPELVTLRSAASAASWPRCCSRRACR